MNKHLNITIYGDVQGVGFRMHARRIANDLGITGFIQNRADGTVYIEAEGNSQQLLQFTTWCMTGPPHASVKNVKTQESSHAGFNSFVIKR
jgi:acylphosphatase